MVARAFWRSEALRVVPWLRPCTPLRLVQGLRPGTTLRASDLHNARATILNPFNKRHQMLVSIVTDSKVHGANMGLTWVLSAPGGPHVGPINLAVKG